MEVGWKFVFRSMLFLTSNRSWIVAKFVCIIFQLSRGSSVHNITFGKCCISSYCNDNAASSTRWIQLGWSDTTQILLYLFWYLCLIYCLCLLLKVQPIYRGDYNSPTYIYPVITGACAVNWSCWEPGHVPASYRL